MGKPGQSSPCTSGPLLQCPRTKALAAQEHHQDSTPYI